MASAIISNLMLGIRDCWTERTSLVPAVPDKYIVEFSFLSKYFTSDCLRTCYDGIGTLRVFGYDRQETYECHHIIITGDDTINGPTGEALHLYYFGSEGFYSGVNYGLVITDKGDNVLYWREVGQSPRTEWLINCLAEDLKDAEGDFVFKGEPTNF